MSGTASRVTCDAVCIAGVDATSFIDSQLSQSVSSMDVGTSCWSLLLEPDGHFGDWLRVVRTTPERWIVLGAQSRTEAIIERLGRFRLRERVDLSAISVEVVIAPDREQGGGARLPRIWARPDECELLIDLGARETSGESRATLEERRIAEGRLSPDDVAEGDNPFVIGAGRLALAVSFTKGCYTGQELVARMDSRAASAPRRLVIGRSEGALEPGAPLMVDAKEVGVVRTSIDRRVGVCLVARSVSVPYRGVVTCAGAPVTLDDALESG